ncbi:hypothetical protein [Staphylococcus aureus]|nr:hypothetical protein [Staphylococcus aureus]UTW31769.1 hypothetical protein KJP35_06745 [Staphylococcus aureus]HDD7337264.1 hypothetical protein [Staphylococcus aureus]HEH0783139.1 hypothetical protein [Staphylococcus aureus]HEJ6870750.1 hypothetical protein [Staphylococcus aureus]
MPFDSLAVLITTEIFEKYQRTLQIKF